MGGYGIWPNGVCVDQKLHGNGKFTPQWGACVSTQEYMYVSDLIHSQH